MGEGKDARAPSVSAIVATYNWPQALDRVLDGLTRQTYPHLEIIVADDGSRPETAALVEEWAGKSPFPVHHSWQPDEGYRLARSRNLAASKATGDYLLMLDGDGLVFPTFIEKHVANAEPGWFTAGRRCYLRRWACEAILKRRLSPHLWPRGVLVPIALLGGSNRPFQIVSWPMSEARRKNRPTEWDKAQTCNLGLWRSDFERVAGFEEGFETYGLEDTDFVVRLMRSGVRRITLEHADPVLHLWHKRRAIPAENRARLAEVMAGERLTPTRSLLLEGSHGLTPA